MYSNQSLTCISPHVGWPVGMMAGPESITARGQADITVTGRDYGMQAAPWVTVKGYTS